VTGYLTFWIFWASATAGRIFTILLTPALVVVVVWLGVRLRRHLMSIGYDLLRPVLLWIASSLLIFSLGSMYPSSRILTSTAESRFVGALPIDNEVPLILANALQVQHRPLPHPLYGVWDSSDRPPLQAGVYLSQEAMLPGSDAQAIHYEVVGTLLQGLWIFGIWGLLAAVRARARLVALVLTAIVFSGFVLVNTFFTWPKLFPAAYLALLAAVLLTPSFKRWRGSAVAGATAGGLAGAALLAHEGSGLALLVFIIVMVIQRRKPSKRFLMGAAAVLVATQGSWMVFQRVVDPSGDQLARLQIANQVKLPGDPRPLLTVIVATYGNTPFGTVVGNKVSNFETPFADIPAYIESSAHLVESYFMHGPGGTARRLAAVRDLRHQTFYYLVPSVGLVAFGFFAWAAALFSRWRRPTPVMRLANTIWLFLIANIITWALILFGPAGTVLHQGSYITGLLAFTACVIGLWVLSPRLCATLVFIQASLAVIVYGLNGPPSNVPHHLDTQMLGLTVFALAFTLGSLCFAATEPSLDADHPPPDAREWTPSESDSELLAASR
jgi:hypothetical protein